MRRGRRPPGERDLCWPYFGSSVLLDLLRPISSVASDLVCMKHDGHRVKRVEITEKRLTREPMRSSRDAVMDRCAGAFLDPPDQRILTRAEYDRHYGRTGAADDKARPLHRVIEVAMSNRPLLFLGCSLKTP